MGEPGSPTVPQTQRLLVAMGVADHVAEAELAAVAERWEAGYAFLQLGEPALVEELGALLASGVERVELVGWAVRGSAPGVSWLRRVAGHRVRAEVLSGAEPVIAVGRRVAQSAEEIGPSWDQTSPLTGREAELSSPAWERVPGHRHQVLVCRGPRCSARGGAEVAAAVAAELRERGLGDDEVLVTQTGCQYPCNQAPVVSVQPDDVWYGAVQPADAAVLVDEHLVAGEPPARLRLERVRRER